MNAIVWDTGTEPSSPLPVRLNGAVVHLRMNRPALPNAIDLPLARY